MSRVGDALRAQREKKSITLDQAAADTRIREKFLKALEDGDYQSLPGAVYTKGFLRNYAHYLDLPADELVVGFHEERGLQAPEVARTFRPIRPIMRRNLIFTPVVLVPVVVLAGIVLFVGYLFYQFTSFAVAPTLEILDPATDAIAHDAQYVVKGRTVVTGKVTILVEPAVQKVADVRPGPDGAFSATIDLAPGSNRITVDVLDQTGKANEVSRRIIYQPQIAASSAPAVALTLDEPANGARVENAPVSIVGRVDPSVFGVVVNGATVAVQNGRFEARFYFPSGPTQITVIAQNASGGSVTLARQVTVVYTSAVVQVFFRGGEAWMQATVDGTVASGTGRVYAEGETATFTGKTVAIRSGNGAVTNITYNGVYQGTMGSQGQVTEKVYRAQ